MKKLGLVVGRFQPLHDGHRFLITKAISENDSVVICIGEARKSDPLRFRQRKKRLLDFLKNFNAGAKKLRIIHIKDSRSDETWVKNLVKRSGLTGETSNWFYTADGKLPKTYIKALNKYRIKEKFVKRISFIYHMPDGRGYRVSSATEIRKLHDKLKISL